MKVDLKMNDNNTITDVSLLIFTCDKFSDLWESGIGLLNKNWDDRRFKTYLVTDKATDKSFQNVTVISAGENTEFSERMKVALDTIGTEYVLVTLDDYFFTKPIDDKLIMRCLDIARRENFDYLRLYTFLNAKYVKDKYGDYDDIYSIDTKSRYNVNLYPAIFSKKFLYSTVSEKLNAWQYEVSLTKKADVFGAKCAIIKPNAIDMLDVVRKGRILRPAYRFLKKNGLYNGERPVMGIIPHIKINSVYLIKRIFPRRLLNSVRRLLIRMGAHFYSSDYEQ